MLKSDSNISLRIHKNESKKQIKQSISTNSIQRLERENSCKHIANSADIDVLSEGKLPEIDRKSNKPTNNRKKIEKLLDSKLGEKFKNNYAKKDKSASRNSSVSKK